MSEEPIESVTVILSKELADTVRRFATHYSLGESEAAAQLLTEALVYCHGQHETGALRVSTPVVRMANALMVQALDNGIDTLRLVPTAERLQVLHWRDGEAVTGDDAVLTREIPIHIYGELCWRYEHLARSNSRNGPGLSHPDAPEWGQIRATHGGAPYDIQVRFLPREPGATGEIIELAFPPTAAPED